MSWEIYSFCSQLRDLLSENLDDSEKLLKVGIVISSIKCCGIPIRVHIHVVVYLRSNSKMPVGECWLPSYS